MRINCTPTRADNLARHVDSSCRIPMRRLRTYYMATFHRSHYSVCTACLSDGGVTGASLAAGDKATEALTKLTVIDYPRLINLAISTTFVETLPAIPQRCGFCYYRRRITLNSAFSVRDRRRTVLTFFSRRQRVPALLCFCGRMLVLCKLFRSISGMLFVHMCCM